MISCPCMFMLTNLRAVGRMPAVFDQNRRQLCSSFYGGWLPRPQIMIETAYGSDIRTMSWAREVAQLVAALAAKPGDPGWRLRSHHVEREQTPKSCSLISTYVPCVYIHTRVEGALEALIEWSPEWTFANDTGITKTAKPQTFGQRAKPSFLVWTWMLTMVCRKCPP